MATIYQDMVSRPDTLMMRLDRIVQIEPTIKSQSDAIITIGVPDLGQTRRAYMF